MRNPSQTENDQLTGKKLSMTIKFDYVLVMVTVYFQEQSVQPSQFHRDYPDFA